MTISSYKILESLFNHTLILFIPKSDITEDDCYVKKDINKTTLHSIKLEPIKITHVDLSELKYAQHRLNKFDEQRQQQLNKPFFIQHEDSILH